MVAFAALREMIGVQDWLGLITFAERMATVHKTLRSLGLENRATMSRPKQKAEGTGLEPATGKPAPDFESGS